MRKLTPIHSLCTDISTTEKTNALQYKHVYTGLLPNLVRQFEPHVNLTTKIPYSGNFSWGPNFVLGYLQLIRVFNFRSVHFTQENTPRLVC